ncbi:proline dehydrogenase family protein [Paenibacillus sp. GCM10027627]|uniref:proline dehydrogenase family protein n=1 Tax=unclassified Paenibacillus TaxID=185978 RepID=UPI003627365C
MKRLDLEKAFADAMKSLARRADLKTYVERTPAVYQLLQRAAAKYVAGDHREAGLESAQRLLDKGYQVSIEYIGENKSDRASCQAARLEMRRLIQELIDRGMKSRISFDLSHIGLSVDSQLASSELVALAEQASTADIELFISMEESAKTESILSIYEQTAALYPTIGITLQAQLNSTSDYLNNWTANRAIHGEHCARRLRLVKGAYQELQHVAIPRSDALNERYLQLLDEAIHKGHRVSVATHDETIINEVIKRGWAHKPGVEFEMLYGIRPDLGSSLKAAGFPVRIYLTYGHEWYLYLCHRIAEYPPNIYQAIIDISNDRAVDSAASYE